MSEGKDEWYVSRSGQRFGPVTFAEMVESARAGRLEPRTDMVIGGGLTEWKPAGEVEGLFEKKEAGKAGENGGSQASSNNSMAASGSYDDRKGQQQALKLPGAPRLGYFLGVTVLPVLLFIGLMKIMPQVNEFVGKEAAPWATLLLFLAPLIVVVAIIVKRFQNLAMTGWWFFGLFVPILSWWVGYRLFACPAGYAYTKKLDVIGKVLAVIYWLSLVGSIAGGAMLARNMEELNDPAMMKKTIENYERTLKRYIPKSIDLPKKSDDKSN
ncbi:GYF domain-containing protein [Haloferula sp.]|uniref:GYF domain-containing protein n=1 Tax=Haloferula sp. TaxID=2497595 RepID=UPI003C776BCA